MLWQSKMQYVVAYHRKSIDRIFKKPQKSHLERSDIPWLTHLRNVALLRLVIIWLWGAMLILLCGCNVPMKSTLPTPLPTEYLPTVVALTLEAGKTIYPPLTVDTPTNSPSIIQETVISPPTSIPLPSETSTPKPETPSNIVVSPTAISYGDVSIPQAEIEIRTPGHLSKVVSPIPVYAILKPGYEKRVRVELIGEDQRVLTRQIIAIPYLNREGEGILSLSLNFEIPGTAEAARLSISTEDEFGRMTALNSIPLILMSVGEADLIPALDMRQPIFIQQPAPKTLIQGDTVVVSGRAHPDGDEFIMIQLVAEDGKVVGKRICSLTPPDASDYGMYVIDVPFTVTESTPVLMMVWQSDDGFSNIIHLTSQEILLSP